MTNITHTINSRLGLKGVVIFSIPLFFGLLFLLILAPQVQQADQAYRKENVAKRASMLAGSIPILALDSGMQMFDMKYKPDPNSQSNFHENEKLIVKNLNELKKIGQFHPELTSHTQKVVATGTQLHDKLVAYNNALQDENRSVATEPLRREFRSLITTLFQEAENLNVDQKKTLESIPSTDIDRINLMIAAGNSIALAVCILLGWVFLKDVSGRIGILLRNTERMAKRDELLAPVPGTDEISQLDQLFHELAETLEHAEQEKRRFLAIMNSRLREPFIHLLESMLILSTGGYGLISSKGVARAASTEKTVARLISLINELIDVEQIESGRIELDLRETDLAKIVSGASEAVRAMAEKRKVTLSLPSEQVKLTADAERIIRVLTNLLSNAIKYAPEGTTVAVELANGVAATPPSDGDIDEGDYLEITVSDKGPGIPTHMLDSIFEKFEQVDQVADTRRLKGTGLGLPICKSIIEEHGGAIGVKSIVGEGSRFWFRIPV